MPKACSDRADGQPAENPQGFEAGDLEPWSLQVCRDRAGDGRSFREV